MNQSQKIACSSPTNCVGRGQSASRALLLETSQQSLLPPVTGSCNGGSQQIVLLFFGQALNPSRQFLLIRASVQRRRSRCGNFNEVFINSEELDQRMEGSGQFAQTSRHRWLQVVRSELSILCAKQPSEIEAAHISTQK